MVLITKDEKTYICEHFPEAHIVRTMRQKSKRHRYFCEESRAVMNYLNSVRSNCVAEEGGAHGTRKKKRGN